MLENLDRLNTGSCVRSLTGIRFRSSRKHYSGWPALETQTVSAAINTSHAANGHVDNLTSAYT